VPRDRHQPAAQDRPDDQPDGGDHRVGPHGQPELLAREGVGDQGGGVGEQEGAAHALHDPPEDELGTAAGEAGAERGQREDHEAADVGVLSPEQIRQPPGRQHEHGRGDHVGEDHPDELEDARAQRALEVGQGDDQRARVDRGQQHAQAGARQGPPLVVLVL
jgi:hypothetical protein